MAWIFGGLLAVLFAALGWVVWFLRMEDRSLPPDKPQSLPEVLAPPAPALPARRMGYEGTLDDYAAACGGKWFYARVAGVGYQNDDKTSREKFIAELARQQELCLDPDPHNKHGSGSAVRVLDLRRRQIGFLESLRAYEVTCSRARGIQWRAFVVDYGKLPQYRNLEVLIALLNWDPENKV